MITSGYIYSMLFLLIVSFLLVDYLTEEEYWIEVLDLVCFAVGTKIIIGISEYIIKRQYKNILYLNAC